MKRLLGSVFVLFMVLGMAGIVGAADTCGVLSSSPAPAQVPEPATIIFLFSGLTGIALYRRMLKR